MVIGVGYDDDKIYFEIKGHNNGWVGVGKELLISSKPKKKQKNRFRR
jgi:hypothetical protein